MRQQGFIGRGCSLDYGLALFQSTAVIGGAKGR